MTGVLSKKAVTINGNAYYRQVRVYWLGNDPPTPHLRLNTGCHVHILHKVCVFGVGGGVFVFAQWYAHTSDNTRYCHDHHKYRHYRPVTLCVHIVHPGNRNSCFAVPTTTTNTANVTAISTFLCYAFHFTLFVSLAQVLNRNY